MDVMSQDSHQMEDEPKDNESTVILHDLGDSIVLIIGNKKSRLQVSRGILSILSPVFKAMLNGKFREAAPTTTEISLPDDDPEAMRVMLLIAHLKFKDLPETLLLHELFEVAVVCDKYDMADVFKPFFDKYSKQSLDKAQKVGSEEWVHIAWTFNLEHVLRKVIGTLALETTLLDGCLYRSGRPLESILPLNASGKSVHSLDFHAFY
jgi:hypothetical protein